MKCFGALAGCALATGALYADLPISHDFESANPWTGGSLFATNYVLTTDGAVAGRPLPSANHTKVLSIEGNASYAPESAVGSAGKPLVDMMVQTARPDDELGFPSSETTDTIQIAVAVDSNGCFNAYCQNKSGTIGWYKLSNTVYDQTGWARVSFLFDYTVTPKRCQIRIDGQPVMSAYGYLTAGAAAGDTASGAWYTLANSGNGVTSMKVIGCTAIDDVLMDSTSTSYAIVANAAVGGVPCSWYDQYGIAWDSTVQAYDGSGMTIAAKYNSCLSPLDGQVFEIKSVGVKDESGTKKVTVAVPTPDSTRSDRQIVVEYSTDSSSSTSTTEPVPANATSVDITAPAGGATMYYRLKAVDNN